MRSLLLAGIGASILALSACVTESGSGSGGAEDSTRASIAFASHGGIYDWAADGDRGIYIQDNSRQWYYAKLLAPCINLPFAQRVGFVTEPGSGSFNKFSSIIVRGQQCFVQTFAKSAPPPSKTKHWRQPNGAPGPTADTPEDASTAPK
ncbi:MAG TPA: DUF6491 family protein [Steroidobacteraceae bacterium]|nr:DUF6491 family protein [Steroidobacteraceae bacterium]